MLRRWLYRSRQFFAAWGPPVAREDIIEVRKVLGSELYALFAQMPRQYRLHSLNVYRRVRHADCNDPTVWQAALLHDMGKSDPASGSYVTIVHRVLAVLLSATPPGKRLLKWLSRPVRANVPQLSLDYLRYPFYMSEHHPQIGAQRAAKHGASHQLVELIKNHHTYEGQSPGLKALQAADDMS